MNEEEKKEENLESESIVQEKIWIPKTSLGKMVFEGKIKSIKEILENGLIIREPEIIDTLIPNLKTELILIGGRTGKGGGIQRIPIKITARMHYTGRRFRYSAFAVVGNEDGIIGIGRGKSNEPRFAIEKSIRKAKLNVILVKRGCGSWECKCKKEHSIPFKTEGKCGSVKIVLYPAPRGVGLVANDEAKKILKLAGIKDVWMKSFGETKTRINFITAIFNALKNLYIYEKG